MRKEFRQSVAISEVRNNDRSAQWNRFCSIPAVIFCAV
jgi:hypothetical protein